jgi:hypothetical protein
MSRSWNPNPERAFDAARDLLDQWALQPLSRWLALAAGFEAGIDARAAAEGVLGAVVPACISSYDEWLIRDLADTAWQMAPRDVARIPEFEARRARHLVERMALAHLVRDTLDDDDFTALTAHLVA